MVTFPPNVSAKSASATSPNIITKPTTPATITTDNITLQVSKALRQLYRADESYGLKLWPTEVKRNLWQHDLSVMLAYGDLKSVTLRVVAKDDSVPFSFDLAFTGMTGKTEIDSAQGIELPMLPLDLIAGGEAVVNRCGKENTYRQFLQGNWTKASERQVRPGINIVSEHAGKITGGRLAGQLHVANDARRELVVTQVGERGFAFAKAGDLACIFLHLRYAPKGFAFKIGERLSAVLIQTPRGLQARDIRPQT